MYDDSITKTVILNLYIGPIVFLAVAAFAFSNQAIYKNDIGKMETIYVFPHSRFKFVNLFNQLTPATPLIIGSVAFLVFRIIKS